MTNYGLFSTCPVLERLEIRPRNEDGLHHFAPSDLLDHAECIPTLRQIRVHCSLLEGDDSALEEVDTLLKGRAHVGKQENGMTMKNPEEAGIIVFNE